MTYLYLKADIYPDLQQEEKVKAAYKELIEASLQEPGCSFYDLVVDPENPDVWHMFEKWNSKQDWDLHMLSEHVAKIQALEPSLTVKPTVLSFFNPVD